MSVKYALFVVLLASQAQAVPYFRVLDYTHPKPVIGALLDPTALGNTEAASLLPLITHSPKDGCLLPAIVCEDWTPLAVGASMNAGKITLDVSPLANVLPWVQNAALAIVPVSWEGVQKVLSSNVDHSVSFSAGPVWQYSQRTNKGYFKIFTGLALSF